MRRHGRTDEAYRGGDAARAAGAGEDRFTRIWNVTRMRAVQWSRRHRGATLNDISWNALWEKVRDELYGAAWACDERRGLAQLEVAGAGRRVLA